MINLQDAQSRPTNGCLSNDSYAIKFEMVIPSLGARIVKWG
jgi:hypothetical protein